MSKYGRSKYSSRGAGAKHSGRQTSRGGSATSTTTSNYASRRKKKSGFNPMYIVTGAVVLLVIVMAVLVASKDKPQRQQDVQRVKAMPPKGTLINAAIGAVRSNMPGGGSFASASEATYDVQDLGGSEYRVTGYVTTAGQLKAFEVHLRQRSSGLDASHVEVGNEVYVKRGKRMIFQ